MAEPTHAEIVASIVRNTLPPRQRDDEVTANEYAAQARREGIEMTQKQARDYLNKMEREGLMEKRFVVVEGKRTAVFRMVDEGAVE